MPKPISYTMPSKSSGTTKPRVILISGRMICSSAVANTSSAWNLPAWVNPFAGIFITAIPRSLSLGTVYHILKQGTNFCAQQRPAGQHTPHSGSERRKCRFRAPYEKRVFTGRLAYPDQVPGFHRWIRSRGGTTRSSFSCNVPAYQSRRCSGLHKSCRSAF